MFLECLYIFFFSFVNKQLRFKSNYGHRARETLFWGTSLVTVGTP